MVPFLIVISEGEKAKFWIDTALAAVAWLAFELVELEELDWVELDVELGLVSFLVRA